MDYLLCHLLIWITKISSYLRFGYRNGVQTNTKFSPFVVQTRRTPRLTCDNNLVTFINVEKEKFTLEEMTQLMVEKLKFISNMHSFVLENVDQEQKRQHRNYVAQKGKQKFVGFEERKTMVKMRKPKKRRALLANWEGSYALKKYKDDNGCREFDDDSGVCIIKGIDGK